MLGRALSMIYPSFNCRTPKTLLMPLQNKLELRTKPT
ncbi:MAG: hypothetical protein ACI97X_001782 [Oceanospirillaceae bacterium]